MKTSELQADLAVIGNGFCGMAAALFAANRGLRTIRVGGVSEIAFASGLIDLMGVHPVGEGTLWDNPWDAIDALKQDLPGHPFARMQKKSIHSALDEFITGLKSAGVVYERHLEQNVQAITPIGTVKTTYAVPKSMWNGVVAMKKKSPCLIVGISGLLGFSSRQIVETLKSAWPDLHHTTISFPDLDRTSEIYTEPIARSLNLPLTRARLAAGLRPYVREVNDIGFPAIFGIQNTDYIISDMQDRLGCHIFEIPTMPPSIPGLRIKEAMDTYLREIGVRALLPEKILNARHQNKAFVLKTGGPNFEHTMRAKAVILASGRFLGGGLIAERKQVREAIFNLPVYQPQSRKEWHRRNCFDPRGHAINRSGLEIDDQFRPLSGNGRRAYENLFAAGSILAHQDWMRMKCGAGLGIATAYAAVESLLKRSHPSLKK
jgi:glycerol-3-phosphate dehydrogenase subunit B